MKENLNIDRIVHLTVDYNPDNGKLFWKYRDNTCADELGMDQASLNHFNSTYAGREIINKTSSGYIQLCLKFRNNSIDNDITLLGHRVAWFIFHKFWPKILDHIDGDRLNNRITNLREVTHSENMYNSKKRVNNTSGQTGVSFKTDKMKWKAYYNSDGKQIHLGYFETLDDAIRARKNWEISSGLVFRKS